MLKDRKKYWAVLLASLFLASCNQTQETAEDESSTQATAQSSSAADTTSSDKENASAESTEIGDRLGKLSKSYIEIMESGNYYMAFRSTTTFEGEMMESETMMTVSGDRTAMQSKSADTETAMVMMDDNIYMIDHVSKTVIVMPQTTAEGDETLPEMPESSEPVEVDDIEYIGSGEEDGLVYEEYRTEGGTQIFYYFDGSDLKKNKTIDESFESIMEILELSDNVSEDAFEIPADYQQVTY
jgi:predicted small secreted protein